MKISGENKKSESLFYGNNLRWPVVQASVGWSKCVLITVEYETICLVVKFYIIICSLKFSLFTSYIEPKHKLQTSIVLFPELPTTKKVRCEYFWNILVRECVIEWVCSI